MALQFKTQSADTSYSVADVLGKLTLDELRATANDMRLAIPTKLRKSEYLKEIIRLFPTGVNDLLHSLPRYELELLQQLLQTGKGKSLVMPTTTVHYFIISNHIVQSEYLQKEQTDILTLSDELRPIVAAQVEKELEDPERKQFDQLLQYAYGVLNLYGVTDFENGMNMIAKKRLKVNKQDAQLLGRFAQSAFFIQCSQESEFTGKYTDYLVSPLMFDHETILHETALRKQIRKPKTFTSEEIMAAGEMPVMRFLMPEYKELITVLQKELGLDDYRIRNVLQNMFALLQINSNPIRILQEVLPVEFKSMRQFQKVAEAVMQFSNNSPRWFLKGYSPLEASAIRTGLNR